MANAQKFAYLGQPPEVRQAIKQLGYPEKTYAPDLDREHFERIYQRSFEIRAADNAAKKAYEDMLNDESSWRLINAPLSRCVVK